METKDSLSCSEAYVTRRSAEPDKSIPRSPIPFLSVLK